MLTVTAKRTVRKPEFQILTQEVTLWGYSRLTPRTARAALEIAFGQPYDGEVLGDKYGYHVYEHSTKKFVVEH